MIQYVMAGLAYGSLYALLGLGLLLTLRTTNVLNFAQGELSTLLAFVCFTIAVTLGQGIGWAFIGSLIVAVIVGLTLYNVIIFPIRRRDQERLATVAISLKLAITGLIALYWGPESRIFPALFDIERIEIFGTIIVADQVWMILAGLIGMVLVGVFLRFTSLGLAMRVAAENPDLAQLLGVNLRVVGSAAWVAAALLGSVTGVLLASTLFLSPFMMGLVVLKAFTALVIGGMVSPFGVVIGGLLLGLLESFVAYTLTPLLQDSVGLLIIILVLMFRPRGLFAGQETWRA